MERTSRSRDGGVPGPRMADTDDIDLTDHRTDRTKITDALSAPLVRTLLEHHWYRRPIGAVMALGVAILLLSGLLSWLAVSSDSGRGDLETQLQAEQARNQQLTLQQQVLEGQIRGLGSKPIIIQFPSTTTTTTSNRSQNPGSSSPNSSVRRSPSTTSTTRPSTTTTTERKPPPPTTTTTTCVGASGVHLCHN